MAIFHTRANFTPAAPFPEIAIQIISSATTRAGVCEFLISSDATPNEYMGEYQVYRTTGLGAGAAGATPTPVKRDPFSNSAVNTVATGGFATTEPTVGDVLYDQSVHQKALYRWVAYPGRELMSAATANNGIALATANQATAFSITVSMAWIE